jgi:hypothetical protein
MNFNKLIFGLIGAALVALQTGLSNGFSLAEQVALGGTLLGVLGAWIVPNTPALNTAKTWVVAVGTGTALLATVAGDGLQGQEWLTALLLVLTTAGVYVVPNKPRVQARSFD